MNTIVKFIKHPLTSIVAMGIGIFIGLYYKGLGLSLSIYGDAYQILLKMTVLPILISAIVTSLGRFVSNSRMQKLLGKIILVLIGVSILYAIIGIVIGLVFRPGNISEESREIMSEQVSLQSEILRIRLDETDTAQDNGLQDFLLLIIPDNIFNSLASNQVLAVLVFSIIFGLAVGAIPKKGDKAYVVEFFEEIYLIFSSIISYVMLLLPFALICIMSSEVARSGFNIIFASAKLIITFYIFGILLLVTNSVALAVSVKKSFFKVTGIVAYPSIIAFTTRNSIASMAVAIDSLKKDLGVDHSFAKSVMPLMTVLGRFGNIFYFALVTLFAAQLYYTDLSVSALVVICISIVFAGVATAGASGFATLSLLGLIVEPLGIPFETVLVILLIIDTIIDPLRTTIIVNTNTVLTAILYSQYQKTGQSIHEGPVIEPKE